MSGQADVILNESEALNGAAILKLEDPKTTTKLKEEATDEEITKTIKQLENSLGEIFMSINYLDDPKSNVEDMPKASKLPEELEYDNLDGSLEEMNEEPGRREPAEDQVAEIPRINRDMLRLSLKLNGRPGTPTSRYTPSVYSESDSGIGVSSPMRKKENWPRQSPAEEYSPRLSRNPKDQIWPRLSYQQSPGEDYSPRLSRNQSSMRSTRSFNLDSGKNTPTSLRLNRSFDVETYLGRMTPTDSQAADEMSLRSLTIPMGSTDGRKIIYKKDASPEHLLQLP